MGALDGIRVLDLSRVLAGPYCGQLLADNGADVIKVEAPGGDMNRTFPHVLGPGESTNFRSVNRGKRDITLNLKDPAAREIVYRLVEKMDVVIQSFLPATTKSLGVDWETLSAINPNLIYVTVSGYGQKGELREKAGYDLMVAAYGGVMSLTGEPDRPPVKAGVTLVDLGTGMLAYSGVVTALAARAMGKGGGQRVDVSLLETAVSMLGYHAVGYLADGRIDRREGSGYITIAPYGAFKCGEHDIMIGSPTEGGWVKLCGVLGVPGLATDPRFRSNDDRCANLDALRVELETALAKQPMAHWLEAIEAAGLPVAPINTIDQVLNDPQVLANDMVVPSRTSDGQEVRLLGLPFKLSGTPGKPGAAPPRPGEHNVAVLGELLGMTEGDVRALEAGGAM